jgi:hypothetical protein
MRVHAFLVSLAVVLAAAGCKNDETRAAGAAGSPGTSARAAGQRGAPFPAEVVAVETDGSGITLRELAVGPTGVKEQRVLRVDPTTAATVAALKPGDRVRVVCEPPAGAPPAAAAAPLQACGVVVEAGADTAR